MSAFRDVRIEGFEVAISRQDLGTLATRPFLPSCFGDIVHEALHLHVLEFERGNYLGIIGGRSRQVRRLDPSH